MSLPLAHNKPVFEPYRGKGNKQVDYSVPLMCVLNDESFRKTSHFSQSKWVWNLRISIFLQQHFVLFFWGHHLGPYISYRFFENTNFRFCWIVICWDIQFVVIWFWLIKISSTVHICIWIVVCNSKISILVRFVFHRDSLVVTAAPHLTSTGNLRQQEEGNNTQSVKFRILLLKFKNIIQILWRSKTM